MNYLVTEHLCEEYALLGLLNAVKSFFSLFSTIMEKNEIYISIYKVVDSKYEFLKLSLFSMRWE